MKALILAAGKGKRLRPLTNTRPKPLIPVLDRPFIEYTIDSLLERNIDRIYIVVSYQKEKFKYLQEKYENKVVLLEQDRPLGTGHALMSAKDYIDEDFLLIYGDVYVTPSDLDNIIKEDLAIAGYKVDNAKNYGVLITDRNNILRSWIEKEHKGPGIINAGIYKLSPEILEETSALKMSKRGEYELTDIINEFSKKFDIKVVRIKEWVHLSFPWDILDISKYFFEKRYKYLSETSKKEGYEMLDNIITKSDLPEDLRVNGRAIIEEGVVIKPYTVVERDIFLGRNVSVGPQAYLREFVAIYQNSKIGRREIKNSIIMRNTNALHNGYIGDSIIGENVNLGAGVTIANLRFDEEEIKIKIGDRLVNTGKRKFGAIIGDNVKTGINVSIMPGTIIYPNARLQAGKIYKHVVK